MEENRTIVQKLIAYSKKDGNKNVILLIGYLILQTIVFGIIGAVPILVCIGILLFV